MKIPVKPWLKENLSFSRKDRNAVIFLSILILMTFLVYILLDYIPINSGEDYSEYKQVLEEWQNRSIESKSTAESLFLFNPNTVSEEKLDSLLLPRFVKKNILSYRTAGGKFSTSNDVRKIYGMNDSIFNAVKEYIYIPQPKETPNAIKPETKKQPTTKQFSGIINPNEATSNDLIQFGFSQFQANNIVEYRNSGGRFNSKSDLLKIYGLDTAFYNKIESHLYVEPPLMNPVLSSFPEKEMVKIELNSADTSELTALGGVGGVFASRIIKYRELLGGFSQKQQLLEVYNFPEETFQKIQKNITLDTTEIQKIRINFATYPQLLRHPYFDEKSVKSILNYRNENGPYISVEQILKEHLVDSTTYFLIRPYLNCR